MNIRITLFSLLLAWHTPLLAQLGLATGYQPNLIQAQTYQPAFLAESNLQWGLALDGGFGLSSYPLTLDELPVEASFIDEVRKSQLIEALRDDNRLYLGLGAGLIFNARLGGQNLSLSYRYRTAAYYRVNEPNTLGLILRGNAPYAGERISDQDIRGRSVSFSQIGVGSAWELGQQLRLGLRVNFLLGHRINSIHDLSYDLVTDSLGRSLQLSSQYDWFRSPFSGLNGFGLSLDLGLLYQTPAGWELQFALRDLGGISWQGKRFENTVNINYEGPFITDLGGLNLRDGSDFFGADSLRDLFFADSTDASHLIPLSPVLQLGARFPLINDQTLWIGAVYNLNEWGAAAPLPLVHVGYQARVGWLSLGTQVYGGGLDRIGFGAFGGVDFPIGNGTLSGFYSIENVLAALLPSQGRGLQMEAGISYKLGNSPQVPR